MIIAEDWMVGSWTGDSSLEVRATGTKSFDGGLSTSAGGLEDMVQDEAHPRSEGLELAVSTSVSEFRAIREFSDHF